MAENAAGGVPEYWIFNLADQQVEIDNDLDLTADPPAYRIRTDFSPGQSVLLVLDGQAVAATPVADLLP